MTEASARESGDPPEMEAPAGAGRARGLLLHKLMEEVLTGELAEDVASFAARARQLLGELVLDAAGTALPDVDEIATTAWRTLQLPDIAAMRSRLIPEWPIYTLLTDRSEPTALAGRIDAIAYENGEATVVVDWKSDVDPSETETRNHASQLEDYLRSTGAPRGALVYMTAGKIRWVTIREAA
jgi:ATP-dependent exoDNAse (exonuclease V) beta subunit